MFKQLLAANAIGVCQPDSCRLAGVNENVLVYLLAGAPAACRSVPTPAASASASWVQHLSAFDYLAVSGELEGRMIEYVDHLHEHFVDPVRVEHGAYRLPEQPGYSSEMRRESLEAFRFPGGRHWLGDATAGVRHA